MPKKMYHITQRKNLKSIMEKGLVPQVGAIVKTAHSHDAEPLVYLLDKPAKGLMFGDFVVLQVDVSDYEVLHYDGNGIDSSHSGYDESCDTPVGVEEGDYFTYDTIEPKDLKLVADKNGKVVLDKKKKALAFLLRTSN